MQTSLGMAYLLCVAWTSRHEVVLLTLTGLLLRAVDLLAWLLEGETYDSEATLVRRESLGLV
jgi:hypothetical protein